MSDDAMSEAFAVLSQAPADLLPVSTLYEWHILVLSGLDETSKKSVCICCSESKRQVIREKLF